MHEKVTSEDSKRRGQPVTVRSNAVRLYLPHQSAHAQPQRRLHCRLETINADVHVSWFIYLIMREGKIDVWTLCASGSGLLSSVGVVLNSR